MAAGIPVLFKTAVAEGMQRIVTLTIPVPSSQQPGAWVRVKRFQTRQSLAHLHPTYLGEEAVLVDRVEHPSASDDIKSGLL